MGKTAAEKASMPVVTDDPAMSAEVTFEAMMWVVRMASVSMSPLSMGRASFEYPGDMYSPILIRLLG